MSDFIRRKTIPLDGAEFVISCLTQKALEDFQDEEKKIDGDLAKGREFRRKVIAYALNRAAQAEEHAAEKLKDVLDIGTISTLFLEILKFSGITLASPKAGASGEQEPSSTS